MTNNFGSNVYKRLGVRPLINAGGTQTLWGGSTLSPEVMGAMVDANSNYVEMEELLDKAGEHVAQLMGVEAAYITSGCFAALALSTAACMTGRDRQKISQLPEIVGIKHEVLIQAKHRNSYDREFPVPGGVLVEVGDTDGCTVDVLDGAIGPNTAAVAYLARRDADSSIIPLADVVKTAHAHGVPVIVDAATHIYPVEYFRGLAQSADLVCFSGKYFNAPPAVGLALGKKELMEAVADHGYIGFYNPDGRSFGRGFKIGRHDVIGLVAALEWWLNADHDQRHAKDEARLASMQQALENTAGIGKMEIVHVGAHTGSTLQVGIDSEVAGKDARQVVAELDAGEPRIRVGGSDDSIIIHAHTLNEGEEEIVIDRLKTVLIG